MSNKIFYMEKNGRQYLHRKYTCDDKNVYKHREYTEKKIVDDKEVIVKEWKIVQTWTIEEFLLKDNMRDGITPHKHEEIKEYLGLE